MVFVGLPIPGFFLIKTRGIANTMKWKVFFLANHNNALNVLNALVALNRQTT